MYVHVHVCTIYGCTIYTCTCLYHFRNPIVLLLFFVLLDSILPLRVTKDTPLLGSFPILINSIRWWLFISDANNNKYSLQSFHLREQNGHGMIATWRCSPLTCTCNNCSVFSYSGTTLIRTRMYSEIWTPL